jgi:hypothetical protein
MFFSSATARVQDCNIAGNSSEGSGGGLYLRGENSSAIVNCLIQSNLAFRDGGGISTNWYATPTIRNCTFVSNSAPGDPNNDASGFGGGLFCGYFSDAKVVDCIFWKNGGRLGTELAVGTGFDLDRQCGKLDVSYSNIMMGPNDVFIDNGCTLVYGEGVLRGRVNKADDPLFVAGSLGNFYLSPASPCVDAGSSTAGAAGMSRYTTRTDGAPDSGRVDMGFHYAIREPCKFCDLAYDGVIDFVDFARFAGRGLSEGCGQVGGWCNGADFTFDSRVDAMDLSFFSECWLVRDRTPPMPDPAEWEEVPDMKTKIPVIGPGIVVEMTAREAIDAWAGTFSTTSSASTVTVIAAAGPRAGSTRTRVCPRMSSTGTASRPATLWATRPSGPRSGSPVGPTGRRRRPTRTSWRSLRTLRRRLRSRRSRPTTTAACSTTSIRTRRALIRAAGSTIRSTPT